MYLVAKNEKGIKKNQQRIRKKSAKNQQRINKESAKNQQRISRLSADLQRTNLTYVVHMYFQF